MEKKKILYIITKSAWGGAGKYVYDLATNLDKDEFSAKGGPASGWEVFVAAGGNGPLAQKIKEADIPYYEIKNFQKGINVLKEIFSYFEIIFLLFKIRPDIIHVNSAKAGGIVGTAALDYRFLTLSFGLKTIFTPHGWAFHETRPAWQIALIKILSKIMAFYYSKIICVSEFDRLSAIKNNIAPERKLVKIHNGININEYEFLSKEEARIKLLKVHKGLSFSNTKESPLWIGTIGEFTKNKGQEYLIDAIGKLKTENYRIKAILIGWGEKKSNLKAQISNLKLENDIFLIDNLSPASPYLKAFDVFVFPSVKESLPYALLEAGLADLPIVATRVGGIPEIIENEKEGFLVPPADSDALAQKLKELIEYPEKRKSFGVDLRNKIIREFSLEKMLSATLAAYE